MFRRCLLRCVTERFDGASVEGTARDFLDAVERVRVLSINGARGETVRDGCERERVTRVVYTMVIMNDTAGSTKAS